MKSVMLAITILLVAVQVVYAEASKQPVGVSIKILGDGSEYTQTIIDMTKQLAIEHGLRNVPQHEAEFTISINFTPAILDGEEYILMSSGIGKIYPLCKCVNNCIETKVSLPIFLYHMPFLTPVRNMRYTLDRMMYIYSTSINKEQSRPLLE